MKSTLLLLALTSAGCHNIPRIKASEIHSNTNVFGVSSSVDATGINITASSAKAADVAWKLSFPGVSHTTTAKDVSIPQPKD